MRQGTNRTVPVGFFQRPGRGCPKRGIPRGPCRYGETLTQHNLDTNSIPTHHLLARTSLPRGGLGQQPRGASGACAS